MPLFRYEATDTTGKKVIGSMQVADEALLARRLQAMGYQPVHVEAAGRRPLRQAPAGIQHAAGGQLGHIRAMGQVAPVVAPGQAAPALRAPQSSIGPVHPRALGQFYYELYMSLQAGVSAYQALYDIGGHTADARLRTVAAAMAETVRSGGRIGEAMACYPNIFSPGDCGLVRAGEIGGFVVDALKEMVGQLEADLEARRQCRRYFLYFAMLCGVALFVTIPVVGILPGALSHTWNSGDLSAGGALAAGLPGVIRMLLIFTLPVLLITGGAWWGFLRYTRTAAGRARWHRTLLGIPGFGSLAVHRGRAVFSAALRLLYRGGVNPGDAWAAASASVPNLELSGRLSGQNAVMRNGGKFSESLAASGVFAASDVGLLATGERTGNVEEMLARMADFHHRDAGATLNQLPVTVRWLTLILGAVVVTAAMGFGFSYFYRTIFQVIQ